MIRGTIESEYELSPKHIVFGDSPFYLTECGKLLLKGSDIEATETTLSGLLKCMDDDPKYLEMKERV